MCPPVLEKTHAAAVVPDGGAGVVVECGGKDDLVDPPLQAPATIPRAVGARPHISNADDPPRHATLPCVWIPANQPTYPPTCLGLAPFGFASASHQRAACQREGGRATIHGSPNIGRSVGRWPSATAWIPCARLAACSHRRCFCRDIKPWPPESRSNPRCYSAVMRFRAGGISTPGALPYLLKRHRPGSAQRLLPLLTIVVSLDLPHTRHPNTIHLPTASLSCCLAFDPPPKTTSSCC